jgi:biopolymer transport protein ExbD
MKFRATKFPTSPVEMNMTPMIDVVFNLLVFFIMTFKIAAMEGDFSVTMPKGGSASASSTDLPIVVSVLADEKGHAASIKFNNEDLGNSFKALSDRVIEFVGTGPEREQMRMNSEVEFDFSPSLRYKDAVNAITAVTGYVGDDKELVKLIEKIKFRDNSQQAQ